MFSNIINFFKNIFYKKQNANIDYCDDTQNIISKQNESNNSLKFMDDLKNKVLEDENILDNMNIESLIHEIENNTELLNNLSIEKLENIDKYYDEIIFQYKSKLNLI